MFVSPDLQLRAQFETTFFRFSDFREENQPSIFEAFKKVKFRQEETIGKHTKKDTGCSLKNDFVLFFALIGL